VQWKVKERNDKVFLGELEKMEKELSVAGYKVCL
jgi:hypothetical protein